MSNEIAVDKKLKDMTNKELVESLKDEGMKQELQKRFQTLSFGSRNQHELQVKKDSEGLIKAIRSTVTLSKSKKHFENVNNTFMKEIEGYREMNRYIGAYIHTPETMTLPDMKIVPNPYIILDPISQTVRQIWVNKYCIGFGTTGNLSIARSTLVYDVDVYFLETALKKVQRNKNAGCLTTAQNAQKRSKEGDNGTYIPMNDFAGVWLNFDDTDVLGLYITYVQDKKFAQRKAESIAERNAMKKHPAFGEAYLSPYEVNGDFEAKVQCISWSHDFSDEDLRKLGNIAEGKDKDTVFKGQKVAFVQTGEYDAVEDEDVQLASEEPDDRKAFDEDEIIDIELPEEEKEAPAIDAKSLLIEELNKYTKEQINEVLSNMGISGTTLESLKINQLNMIRIFAEKGVGKK